MDYTDYVDLGLPSGTLWATANTPNPDGDSLGYWTYDELMKSQYKDCVPTSKQMDELWANCQYGWDDERKGVLFVSNKNGRSIFFPVSTVPDPHSNVGLSGVYWTATIAGAGLAYCLYFYKGYLRPDSTEIFTHRSFVRLVANSKRGCCSTETEKKVPEAPCINKHRDSTLADKFLSGLMSGQHADAEGTIKWYKVTCSLLTEPFGVRRWEDLVAFLQAVPGFDYRIEGQTTEPFDSVDSYYENGELNIFCKTVKPLSGITVNMTLKREGGEDNAD